MEEVILALLQYTREEDIIHIYIDGCDNYEFGIDGFEYILAKKKRKKDTPIPVMSKHETSCSENQIKTSPIVEMTETPIH
jgi:hypothetical protein